MKTQSEGELIARRRRIFYRSQGLFMMSSKAIMNARIDSPDHDTISMCLQFLRFGNCEFITISTELQFLRLVFSETITISTLHNFNGRAQRAPEKMLQFQQVCNFYV